MGANDNDLRYAVEVVIGLQRLEIIKTRLRAAGYVKFWLHTTSPYSDHLKGKNHLIAVPSGGFLGIGAGADHLWRTLDRIAYEDNTWQESEKERCKRSVWCDWARGIHSCGNRLSPFADQAQLYSEWAAHIPGGEYDLIN